jgi:hypothetical protein
MVTSPGLTFKKFYVLPTQCIYVFCIDLRTNSIYFPIQYEPFKDEKSYFM